MARGRLTKAAMGLAVAAVAFLLIEGGMRLVAGPPPPPVRVYRIAGDVEHYFAFDGETVTPTYQQVPPVPSFTRQPAGRRVVVLGGSSVHEARFTAASLLEWPGRMANRLDAEVLNLAEPGLDSFDHVRIVDELADVGLDAVVLYAGHNDIGNVLMRDRYGTRWSGVSAHLLAGLEHSQVFCQLRLALLPRTGSDYSTEATTRGKFLTPERRATAIRYYKANIERIAWMLEQRSTPLVLVVPTGDLNSAPVPGPCDPELGCADAHFAAATELLYADKAEAAVFLRKARDANVVAPRATTELQDYLRSLEGRSGITIVDAERSLPWGRAANVPDSSLFYDPIHFSRAGHDVLAGLVAPTVAEVTGIQARLIQGHGPNEMRGKPTSRTQNSQQQ